MPKQTYEELAEALAGTLRKFVETGPPERCDGDGDAGARCFYCGGGVDIGNWRDRFEHAPSCLFREAAALLDRLDSGGTDEE